MGMTYFMGHASFSTLRNLENAHESMSKSLVKLSSGLRVVTAQDDAAAYAIGTRIRSEVSAIKQAIVNTGQGKSMLETAQGGLSEITKALTRMKSLAVQAQSAQNTPSDIAKIDQEFQSLIAEVERIANSTKFNGKLLIGGQTSVTPYYVAAPGTYLQQAAGAGGGFQSITFDSTNSSDPIQFTYTASAGTLAGTLTARNLNSGVSESVVVQNAAIAVGNTELVRFNTLGVTVDLNSNFAKGASVSMSDAGLQNVTVDTKSAGGNLTFTANNAGNNFNYIKSTSGNLNGIAGVGVITITGKSSAGVLTLPGGADGNFVYNGALNWVVGGKDVTLNRTVGVGANQRVDSITVHLDVATSALDDVAITTPGTVTLNESKATAFEYANTAQNASFNFQVGTTGSASDDIGLTLGSVETKYLYLQGQSLIVDAVTAQSKIETALSTILSRSSDVASLMNRLDTASSNLQVSKENLDAAASNLLDLDVPDEMSNFVGTQLLTQTGVMMLAKDSETRAYLLNLLRQ